MELRAHVLVVREFTAAIVTDAFLNKLMVERAFDVRAENRVDDRGIEFGAVVLHEHAETLQDRRKDTGTAAMLPAALVLEVMHYHGPPPPCLTRYALPRERINGVVPVAGMCAPNPVSHRRAVVIDLHTPAHAALVPLVIGIGEPVGVDHLHGGGIARAARSHALGHPLRHAERFTVHQLVPECEPVELRERE